jgi:putative cell wall-binding protein
MFRVIWRDGGYHQPTGRVTGLSFGHPALVRRKIVRRRRLIASAVIPGLLTGLVILGSPADAAIPPLDATKVKVSSTPEIPVGFGAGVAGDIVLGDSTVQFQAGDSVTMRIDDADLDPNCEAGPGFRDFVAFESVPTASIPGSTATVQVNLGSTPLCAAQEGGTKLDVLTVNVLIGGPGPITVSNIRYTAGSSGSIDGSASNGPVQLKFDGGGAVGPPFSLVTANTSNAWITHISLTGGDVNQAILLPSPPVTLNPFVLTERLGDAFGPAGTASDVCLDISARAVWSATPTSATTSTVPSDAVSAVVIDTGPAGPNTRLKVSIQNNPTSVLSTITLTGMKVQPGSEPGKVQVFLTDCDSQPFGTRASGGDPASGTTFATIGYFSNPSTNVASNPIVITPGSEVITRIAGADRIDTANAISQTSFPGSGGAGAVVLARADGFADALAGTPLAVAKSAPMLLTGSASLDSRTLAEIQRVLTVGKTVFMLGGSVALSPAVLTSIANAGYAIVRFDGVDRFDTAMRIARDGLANPSNLLVADGMNFPDALSAGAAAAKVSGAVLLSNGSSAVPITSQYIASRPSLTLTSVGGPAAMAYPAGQAIVGVDRYDTSAQVAARFFPTPGTIGLASGTNFPDALSGGAHIGRFSGPLLLTDPSALPVVIQAYLTAKASSIVGGFVYGGNSAVSDSVRSAAQVSIGGTAS